MQVVKQGKGVGYGPILGDEALRKVLRTEMGRVYRWEEARGGDEDGLDAGRDAEDVGEEGTVVMDNSKEEDEAVPSIPPTWQEIGITSGCNQAFFGIMLTLCEKGDRVLIPVPWVCSSPATWISLLMLTAVRSAVFQHVNDVPGTRDHTSPASTLPDKRFHPIRYRRTKDP